MNSSALCSPFTTFIALSIAIGSFVTQAFADSIATLEVPVAPISGQVNEPAPETELLKKTEDNAAKASSEPIRPVLSDKGSNIAEDRPVFSPEETKNLEVLEIIDNDEQNTKIEGQYKWEEIPDEVGKTHIQAGARFPVYVVSAHSSKTAKVGDVVEGKLKVAIKIGGKEIAPAGAEVLGHVISVTKARRMIAAKVSGKRFLRASGALGVQFDEIITKNGQHIPLVAIPASSARVVKNSSEGRILGVNQDGEIASPFSIQLKSQALHFAISAAASAGGVFSFGAVPAAFGVIGAINPSFAFMQPVGKNVRHRRLKGFGMGVVSGLPGGFLISESIIRGPEAIVKPGDIFLAEFKQNFTGEASSEVSLLPNVKVKVHGEVMQKKQPKKVVHKAAP
jgi:hypothetical protein